ncbi:hypothetical protein ACFX1Z_039332 [Malus domestica]
MAASFIKLKHYEEAIGQCSIVLAEDENNAKRYLGEEKPEQSLGRQAVYQKQKEIYKGIFGATPEPKPKRDNWLIIFWHWPLSLFYRLFGRERYKAE